MIKSASVTLLKPTEKLIIKLSVNLLDGLNKESFYSIYETEMYDYLTMNMAANVIFQFKPPQGIPWDRSHSVHVNDGNIYQVNKFFQDFYRIMNRPGLFTYGTNSISCNSTNEDVRAIALKGSEFMELEPSVIYDTNGTALPGVNLRLNIKDNKVELSIDEFEAIMYKLSKIDITSDAMKLLILRIVMEERIENTKKMPNPSYTSRPPVGNVFQQKVEPKEEVVVDNRSVMGGITSLDDL